MIAIFLNKMTLFEILKGIKYMDERVKERKERLKMQKRFGEHLITLRKSKNLTSAELARRCEMERSNIARIETGRTNPSLFVLKKLSVGLGIELEELLKGFK
jgi:ribosome-binding protein aMBF1 (putative translation factor)